MTIDALIIQGYRVAVLSVNQSTVPCSCCLCTNIYYSYINIVIRSCPCVMSCQFELHRATAQGQFIAVSFKLFGCEPSEDGEQPKHVAVRSGKIYIYILFVCLFSWRYNPLWLYFPQPSSGLQPPRFRGFLITQNNAPQSVGFLWTSDQSVAETST